MAEPQRNTIFVSDKRYAHIEERIHTSYPDSCVLWIEEIINPGLEEKYQKQKLEIENKRGQPCLELELFHGTNEQALNRIVYNGFDPRANKISAYGKGTYFAKYASYSKNYANPAKDEVSFMLICSVLVGNCCKGTLNMNIDTNTYDNSVDDIKNSTIYVTPYSAGAIPRFVVAFYRNAK